MQNAGFVVSREIDGLSPSISLYGQPFNVKLTLQFEHSPGENRVLTVKRLINSLLDELGIPKDHCESASPYYERSRCLREVGKHNVF